MATIHNLNTVREWRSVRSTLENEVRNAGADEDAISHVLTQMEQWWRLFSREWPLEFSLPFPATSSPAEREALVSSVREPVAALQRELKEYTFQLLIRILGLELRFYYSNESGEPEQGA